jgi:hypothetical protein
VQPRQDSVATFELESWQPQQVVARQRYKQGDRRFVGMTLPLDVRTPSSMTLMSCCCSTSGTSLTTLRRLPGRYPFSVEGARFSQHQRARTIARHPVSRF